MLLRYHATCYLKTCLLSTFSEKGGKVIHFETYNILESLNQHQAAKMFGFQTEVTNVNNNWHLLNVILYPEICKALLCSIEIFLTTKINKARQAAKPEAVRKK